MGGRSTDYKSPNSLHCTTAAADFETGPGEYLARKVMGYNPQGGGGTSV